MGFGFEFAFTAAFGVAFPLVVVLALALVLGFALPIPGTSPIPVLLLHPGHALPTFTPVALVPAPASVVGGVDEFGMGDMPSDVEDKFASTELENANEGVVESVTSAVLEFVLPTVATVLLVLMCLSALFVRAVGEVALQEALYIKSGLEFDPDLVLSRVSGSRPRLSEVDAGV